MGVAGRFPPNYMGAMVQGQALGGIIAVTTNIVMLAFGMSDKNAAFWDFLIATIYLVFSFVALIVVTRTEFYQVVLSSETLRIQSLISLVCLRLVGTVG